MLTHVLAPALAVCAGVTCYYRIDTHSVADTPRCYACSSLYDNADVTRVLDEEVVLAPLETYTTTVTISAAGDAEPGLKSFALRVTSAEGLEMDFSMTVVVDPLLPLLVVEPAELYKGVVRPADANTPSKPAVVQFAVRNAGTAATGALALSLPDLPWIRSSVPSPLPGLEPGEERLVTLLLSPGPEVPLTEFRGNLVLAPAVGLSVGVPFRFRVVSELKGDLEIEVVDEFYYFTAEKPRVEGARAVAVVGQTDQRDVLHERDRIGIGHGGSHVTTGAPGGREGQGRLEFEVVDVENFWSLARKPQAAGRNSNASSPRRAAAGRWPSGPSARGGRSSITGSCASGSYC